MQDAHSVELAAGPRAPGLARRRVEAALAGRDRGAVELAMLLASELVSNAVRHASQTGDPVRLELRLLDSIVRIEVVDVGGGFDQDPDARPGYGLRIVDRLSRNWGVEPGPPHAVWCELGV